MQWYLSLYDLHVKEMGDVWRTHTRDIRVKAKLSQENRAVDIAVHYPNPTVIRNLLFENIRQDDVDYHVSTIEGLAGFWRIYINPDTKTAIQQDY